MASGVLKSTAVRDIGNSLENEPSVCTRATLAGLEPGLVRAQKTVGFFKKAERACLILIGSRQKIENMR